MSDNVFRFMRSIELPIREELSWDERWLGQDKGLISCWESGRLRCLSSPELAGMACRGELPVLGWTGGISQELKSPVKYGSLNYLAQWQGLRGDDLDIYTDREFCITCAKTGMRVIFTSDLSKIKKN